MAVFEHPGMTGAKAQFPKRTSTAPYLAATPTRAISASAAYPWPRDEGARP
jgi:hypothetical protein